MLVNDVMDRDDVRMVEGRRGAGFLEETFLTLDVREFVARENFDRDRSVQARVACFVDLAHAASANRCDDFVRAETCAGCDGHARP
jgi:hypothetical protein